MITIDVSAAAVTTAVWLFSLAAVLFLGWAAKTYPNLKAATGWVIFMLAVVGVAALVRMVV